MPLRCRTDCSASGRLIFALGLSFRAVHRRLVEQWQAGRIENFARTQLLQLFHNATFRVRPAKLGGAKLAGGKIERRQSHRAGRASQRRQKIVFFRPYARIDGRPWRKNPCDLAAHQLRRRAGNFHLLADRNLKALAQQLRKIIFRRVIGHAAHGDGVVFFFVARSQRDLQLTRGHHRVFKEEFVEVSQAEEEQRVGMLFLDRGILPHQRSGGFGHGRIKVLVSGLYSVPKRS